MMNDSSNSGSGKHYITLVSVMLGSRICYASASLRLCPRNKAQKAF